MTALLTTPLGEIMGAARDMLSNSGAGLSAELGLGTRIAARNNLNIFFPRQCGDLPERERALRQSPVMAGIGYQLAETGPDLRTDWENALKMLQGRTAFPGDGQYFANDPVELLGILSGILVLEPNGGPHSHWLSELLRQGLSSKAFKTPITLFAARLAHEQLDPAFDMSQYPFDPADLLRGDLLLMTSAILFAFNSSGAGLLPAVEEAFAEIVLGNEIRLNTPAEAAAAILLCQRISDRILLELRGDVSAIDRIVSLCRRFPLLLKPIQNRHAKRTPFEINDEYDVQDLFHGILRLHFDDVRPEEVSPSVAGGSSRVDFLLKHERLVVEAKFMGQSMSQKKLRSQLIEDITLYAAMDHVDTLVCLVYDPDLKCTNPRAIETDLQNSIGRLEVRIIVCPQGQ
ncbi:MULTISPECIES: hypothetical protein [Hyphomonas]|nr:hypothetical protein [Hyphomonas adhaerens]